MNKTLNSLVLTLVIFIGFIHASSAEDKIRDGQLTIYTANDQKFYALLYGNDADYTSGQALKFSWHNDGNLLQKLGWYNDGKYSFRNGIELSQLIFTPKNITSKTVDPNDRPYAGWTSLNYLTDIRYKKRSMQELDRWQFSFGIVGSAALGKQVQQGWHKLIGFDHPEWPDQVADTAAAMLSYTHHWIHRYPKYQWLEIAPYAGGDLGNVYTTVKAGSTIKMGIVKGLYSEKHKDKPTWRLYATAGAEARAVLYNIFLDGASIKGSSYIPRRVMVYDFTYGYALAFPGHNNWLLRHCSVNYRFTNRSPEIDDATRRARFGEYRFNFGYAF